MHEYIQAIAQQNNSKQQDDYKLHQALKARLEAEGLKLDYDLRRTEIGGPTFILWQGANPAGYIFTVAIGSDLEKHMGEQHRLPNLILTNYVEFRRYHEGILQQTAQLATLSGQQIQPVRSDEPFTQFVQAFARETMPTITRADDLAERLGNLTAALHHLLWAVLYGEAANRDLLTQLRTFQHFLPDITPESFTDMLAQATTSGLFAARIRHHGEARQQVFNRRDVYWDMPPTNTFFRHFFQLTNNADYDVRVTWAVDALAALLARVDIETLLTDLNRATRIEDPVADFYAAFARNYGPLSENMASDDLLDTATPYLVKSVNTLLNKRFNYALGLADEHIRVVDLRAGSGRTLYRIVQQMYETLRQQQQLGAWDTFVQDHLLEHVIAYEPSLSDFAAAQLKLGIQFQRRGYRFASNQRLRLYLTPGLQPPAAMPDSSPLAQLLHEESVQGQLPSLRNATPVLFGCGQNQGVELLREGQRLIQQHGMGIIAAITPVDFLDQEEYTALRRSFIENFRDIYILHIKEFRAAISLFVKRGSNDLIRVRYAAAPNLHWLLEHDLSETDWEILPPNASHYSLLPDQHIKGTHREYAVGWKLSDILPVHLPALNIVPEVIAYTYEGAQQQAARAGVEQVMSLAYRPFDTRFTPQESSPTLQQMLKSENRFLCISYDPVESRTGTIFCTHALPHQDITLGQTTAFPLYLYPAEPFESPFPPRRDGGHPNLSHAYILEMARRLHMTFIPLDRGDLKYTFGAKDVFAYLYAVLSSSQYRTRYDQFLADDLPYVPLTNSKKRFRTLAKHGRQLARLHMLREAASWSLRTGFTGSGDQRISADHPTFIELAGEQGGRIYINQRRYFTGVERRVWKLQIGGYSVLQEWLHQRQGHTLTWAEIHRYQQIIIALERALRCLELIDESISGWPLD